MIYNKNALQPGGTEERCYIKAVSYSPVKGGEADVEKKAAQSFAYRDFRGDCSYFTYHKSVLTARLAPRQSA